MGIKTRHEKTALEASGKCPTERDEYLAKAFKEERQKRDKK